MDFTILSSVVTVISLLVFLGIWYWAFKRNNKARFEQLAYLPLENDEFCVERKQAQHSARGNGRSNEIDN